MKELFDARDKNENKLGFDIIRGENYPKGAYHWVVDVFVVNEKGEILTTKRDYSKGWGGLWEVTGGSVLKGESLFAGAKRELYEETGILVEEDALHLFATSFYPEELQSIYKAFMVFVNMGQQVIQLQVDETIDYQFLPLDEFLQFIQTDAYVTTLYERFLEYKENFLRLYHTRFK